MLKLIEKARSRPVERRLALPETWRQCELSSAFHGDASPPKGPGVVGARCGVGGEPVSSRWK